MLPALKLPAFRRLFAAYTLNELTFSIGSLGLALLVYQRTHTAAGATAFFLCSQFAPALFAPFLVSRIDRLRPDRSLPVLYALEAAAFALLVILTGHFSIVPALVLITLDGVLALGARAVARGASAVITTRHGLLREGNALLNGVFSITFMAGPALGAVLVAAAGVRGALLVNVGLFAVIAAIMAGGALPRTTAEVAHEGGRLRAALAHVRAHAAMRILLGLWGAGVLFFTLSIPVEVLFAERTLHGGASGYAALLSAWGAGSVVGSVLYARSRLRSSRSLIVIGAGALGAGFAVMALAPSIVVAAAGSALAGAGNGIEAVSVRTALQELLDDARMTLVMSLNDSLTQGATGGGILLGGAIAALAGPRAALAAGGAGAVSIAAAAWVWLGRVPAIRSVDPAGTSAAPLDPAGPSPARMPASTH